MNKFALGFDRPLLIAGTTVLSMAVCTPVFAQTGQDVLLVAPDGSMSITGALVAVDNEFYTIEGQLGVIQVPRNAVDCVGATCPAEETATPEVVSTREIVLKSVDDETRISGELVDVDDTHYVIRNPLGEFRIMISGVTCEGQACPVIEVFDTEFAIHTPSSEVSDMLVDLLRKYAEETGQAFSTSTEDNATQSVQFFSGEELELAADIDVIVSDPLAAANALADKTADIVVFDQNEITPQLAAFSGLDSVTQTALAYDGDVIIGNKANPVRDLSRSEIDQILNQNLTSWRSLGGGDFPISVHMVDDGSDTAWLNGVRVSDLPGVVTHSTQDQVIEAVSVNRNAIGVVHQTTAVDGNAKMLAVRQVCGLTAEPTSFGLQSEHYPFTQPLSSYANGEDPFVSSFLDWTRTAAASSIVSGFGYTSAGLQRTQIQDMGVAVIHAAAVEPDFDGVEFSTMMRELRDADRLSMTFTFVSGSTVLDDASLLNLKNLAQLLRGSEFDGQEVLLVGFADNTGPAAPNSALSLRRSETVRTALEQEFDPATLGSLNLTSLGFGEQMPVDCNDTDEGRANNRRVEVWVRVQG